MTTTATRRRAQVNREAWLSEVIRAIRPEFKRQGIELPKVRVSVGWPGGRKRKGATTVGECWSGKAASDGVAQIFVSPLISDGRRAVDILIHELCHAADHNENGHSKPFADLARRMGLEGKPTETHAGPDLAEWASALVKTRIGKYPHATLTDGMTTGTKKQTTRMVKMTCPECGRIIRLSKTAQEFGEIICFPCNRAFRDEAGKSA